MSTSPDYESGYLIQESSTEELDDSFPPDLDALRAALSAFPNPQGLNGRRPSRELVMIL
jgi:hypothetical protein